MFYRPYITGQLNDDSHISEVCVNKLQPTPDESTITKSAKVTSEASHLASLLKSPMANYAPARRSGSSTVVTSPSNQPTTLVLRNRVKDLQQETESYLKQKIEDFKGKVKDKSTEELNDYVDEVFGEAQAKVTRCFEDMKAEVKSHAPSRPKRQTGESDSNFNARQEKYQEEVRNYREYVATTASIMNGIMEVFNEVLKKVKEFFHKLWTWIKQLFTDIAQAVSSFIKEVRDTISDGLSRIFG